MDCDDGTVSVVNVKSSLVEQLAGQVNWFHQVLNLRCGKLNSAFRWHQPDTRLPEQDFAFSAQKYGGGPILKEYRPRARFR